MQHVQEYRITVYRFYERRVQNYSVQVRRRSYMMNCQVHTRKKVHTIYDGLFDKGESTLVIRWEQ
jgi:hypothetical protein